MADNTNNEIGTSGEQQIAEAMEHIDSFIFDTLSDPDGTIAQAEGFVPAESELDLSKPVEQWVEITLKVNVKGGEQLAKLTPENFANCKSKTALRSIIAALVTTKPHAQQKATFLHYLNLAVARLNELSA